MMCSVSAIYDQHKQWPVPQPFEYVPQPYWTPETIKKFMDEYAQAQKQDIIEKQPDCVKPEMVEFVRRLEALEASLRRIEEVVCPPGIATAQGAE